MPNLHQYYAKTLQALHLSDPSLKAAFPQSVFSAVTYNLGPRTVCFKHKDMANLAFGMCAITALGDFDPKKGGHLILWECKLVIEFPPGSTVLIPSATISHSNAMVGENELRYSFTQYTAGAIFRWVENGFEAINSERSAEQAKRDAQRWSWGLSLIPQIKI